MPTYNVLRLAEACYLLQDGYVDTFQELLDTYRWQNLRHGVRQSEVRELHGTQWLRSLGRGSYVQRLRGLWATVKAELSTKYNDSDALAMLNEPAKPVHSYNPSFRSNRTRAT